MIQDIKTLKRLLLLLVVAVVLLGVSFAFTLIKPGNEPSDTFYVINSPVSEVAAIAIKNSAGLLSLYNSDEGLVVMQDDAVVPADITAAQSLYYELCHLPAKRQFAKDELTIDFTQVLAQIVYMDTQGGSKHYTVATTRGPFDEYYLREPDGDTVYLIAPEAGRYFEMNALGLQDKSVLPNLTPAVIPFISEVEIKDYRKQNSYKISCSNEGGLLLYAFSEPVNNRIEANMVWEQLFVPLSQVYGENTIPLDTAITDPDYKISAKIEGKAYTFFVKITPETGLLYRENQMVALTISNEKLAFLEQSYESFLMGKAFSVSPGYLDRVVMQENDKEYVFEINETETGVMIAFEGKTVSYADQAELFKGLFEIPIQSKLEPQSPAAQMPTLTIRYYYKNGVTDSIALYKTENENQFVVESNGASYFTTFASTLEKLMRIVD